PLAQQEDREGVPFMPRTRMIAVFAVAMLVVAALGAPVRAGDHCGSDCCEKVCRPVPDKKTITKRCYSDRCEDFCLSPCAPFPCLLGGCPCCGKVKTKKVLTLRVKKCEKPTTKCIRVVECPVMECAPPCPPPCAQGGVPGHPVPAGAVPTGMG